MGWITRKICEAVADFFDGLVETLNALLFHVFNSTGIVNGSQIQTCVVAVQTVATVLVSLMVVKQLLSVYILETDGDSETDPLSYLVKASISLALIWTCPVITNMLIGYAGELYEFIRGRYNIEVGMDTNFRKTLLESGMNAISSIVFGCVYIVALVMLMIKAALRGVELAIIEIVYPIFCVDIITTSQERWKTFFSSYIVVAFGYIIQLLCLQLSYGYSTGDGYGSGEGEWIFALAFLFFAVKAPNWLEKFAYASGAGRSAAGAARSAMYMIPMLRRR